MTPHVPRNNDGWLMSTDTKISLTLNGDPRSFDAPLSVSELLKRLPLPMPRVAVLRNSEVVKRENHPVTMLEDGDTVDIISMVGGG